MGKALTFTVVFKADSLNYGEGIANISELKKIHRGNGDVHTFSSRQSIRYDIVRLGNEWFDWNLDTVDKAKGTVQFRENVTINDSTEMDLFGYLKTGKKSEKRPAVARLSHAVSLEPYRSDMEFLNNMGLAARIDDNPNLANIEHHESLYSYTVTMDLDKVGIDGELDLGNGTRIERIHQLLDIIKLLNRNIRGRQETLSPLFVVGGVYDVANPFFLGRVQLRQQVKDWQIQTDILQSSLEASFAGQPISEQTYIGFIKGIFGNEEELVQLGGSNAVSVEQFFELMKESVAQHFGVVHS
ncbi:type I-B CRISPR-associated protein Cas7/Cst2/DevR [Bacillus solimangrovi]|uniref:Type I-B CRISPR-associated protein Cas7/Cst2/DevR n=1 Tax=Bacillus solimangrovi TaxID=1305675 RepID=A0A1E5LG19_9BACI|nr:type I-B CRISPR-associated protein Cas7/Cst2/DevR [Bacillus solimangrovi]OEH93021.1 type I-B CRISPR-associated protein Cas7/Cst2/DevR [Bacillus solimangrovi]